MGKVQHLYGEDVDTHMWEGMGYKEVLELKAELAYHEYKTPPVTDLQMVAMAEYHKENRNTKSKRRRKCS